MLLSAFNRKLRFIKRYKESEDGATAVEFGLVAAPFFYLLLAIFETGIMLFSEYVIENGTAQASRLIRTGQAKDFTQQEFKDKVCEGLGAFLDCTNRLYVDVQSFTDFSSVNTISAIEGDEGEEELSEDITLNSNFDPGAELEVVVVRVYYDWKLFTPGISYLSELAGGRRLLSSSAAFRNEPFGT